MKILPGLTIVCAVVAWGAFVSLADEETGTPAAEATLQSSEPQPTPPGEDPLMQVKKYIQEKTDSQQINKNAPNWKTRLPRFPSLTFDGKTQYFWNLKTNLGEMKLRLMPDAAPNHVANCLYLTELGFYDGLIFHRVIQGFMAQGGCPLGTGTGSPGYGFGGEFAPSARHAKAGMLSTANAGPNTDGSQFFITFKATPGLDGLHTVFGEITEGLDVLREIEKRGSADGSGRTSERLVIEKAWITTAPAG